MPNPYSRNAQTGPEVRLRTPRRDKGEMFAVVDEISGGARMIVRCEDGKKRLAKIRGKMRCRIWVRQGDIIIIAPWTEFQSDDTKATIVWRYTETQALKLRRQGMLHALDKKPEGDLLL